MQAASGLPYAVAKKRHAIRKNSNYKALCMFSSALQEIVAKLQHGHV
jgi:hypothetical protein